MFLVLSDTLRMFCFEFILPAPFKIYKEGKKWGKNKLHCQQAGPALLLLS